MTIQNLLAKSVSQTSYVRRATHGTEVSSASRASSNPDSKSTLPISSQSLNCSGFSLEYVQILLCALLYCYSKLRRFLLLVSALFSIAIINRIESKIIESC